jgi:hypothetical protein
VDGSQRHGKHSAGRQAVAGAATGNSDSDIDISISIIITPAHAHATDARLWLHSVHPKLAPLPAVTPPMRLRLAALQHSPSQGRGAGH